MGSELVAFEIWLVVLCLNGGFLLFDAAFDTPLVTPFDTTATITPIRTGTVANIYNTTGIYQSLNSSDAQNSTIGGSAAILNPIETLFFPLALLWTFIQFVTGGFVFQVLAIIGGASPLWTTFTFVLQGVIGILFARSIVYWVWGR